MTGFQPTLRSCAKSSNLHGLAVMGHPASPTTRRLRYASPVKTVVLIHPDGDRVELFITGRRLDWVHLRRFKSPVHEQMDYETGADIERALMVRFGDLTKRGFQVADVPVKTRAALDLPADALERGLGPLVVRRIESQERAKLVTWLAEFEQSGLVAQPWLDEQQIIPHIPGLHRFVLGMQTRTLVLDGNPSRDMRQAVADPTKLPPHGAWLRAWLGILQKAPGEIHDLCLRACRLVDLDRAELTAHLQPFAGLAFVGSFPRDLASAAHATSLTLGLTDADTVLPDAILEALAKAPMRVERLALELARGRQELGSPLADVLRTAKLPALRELAITGLAPTTVIVALVESPVLAQLTRLRIDAPIDTATLDHLREHADALGHLERLELRPLSGSKLDGIASLRTVLPAAVELVDAPPVCPY